MAAERKEDSRRDRIRRELNDLEHARSAAFDASFAAHDLKMLAQKRQLWATNEAIGQWERSTTVWLEVAALLEDKHVVVIDMATMPPLASHLRALFPPHARAKPCFVSAHALRDTYALRYFIDGHAVPSAHSIQVRVQHPPHGEAFTLATFLRHADEASSNAPDAAGVYVQRQGMRPTLLARDETVEVKLGEPQPTVPALPAASARALAMVRKRAAWTPLVFSGTRRASKRVKLDEAIEAAHAMPVAAPSNAPS